MKKFLGSSLIAVALLGGCSTTHVVDSVDELFELFPLHGPSGRLHGAYVAGADIDLFVLGDHEDVSSWTLEADDPTIVKIGQLELATHDQAEFDAKMVGVGTTTVWAVDPHGGRHSPALIHVAFPDRVDLVPSGALFVDDEMTASNTPQIVESGLATFYVRYGLAGGDLYGSGGLVSSADGGVTTTPESTYLGTRRDWVQISAPSTPGTSNLELSLLDHTIATFPLAIVPDASIISVQLLAESEAHHHRGDLLSLLAESFTADHQPVWGAAYEFTIDGVKQPTTLPAGLGGSTDTLPIDMYLYKYDRAVPVLVEAAHNAFSDGGHIHSDGGYVSSSNIVGCSALPGTPHTSWLSCLLLFACCGWMLRRMRNNGRQEAGNRRRAM